MAFQCGARRAGKVRHSYATLAGLGAYILTTHKETTMPLRFRRSIKILPGVRVNLGPEGITSITIGRATFRRGHTPRVSIPLFGGLTWVFGGKRRQR